MSDERPILVLVHGWAAGPSLWSGIERALGRRFRVLRAAMPGYGNDAAGAGASLEGLSAWLRERTPAGATWLAWSTGALAALDIAAAGDGHIARLNMVAPVVRFTRADGWPCGVDPAVLDEFRGQLGRDPGVLVRRFARLVMRPDGGRDGVERFVSGFADDRVSVAALADGLDVLSAGDVRHRLGDVRVPVTIFHGDRDAVVPMESSRRAAAALDDGRLCVLEGAGHAPFVTAPDEFIEQLESHGRH